ncbi:murein hydrolase activator EnvC [Castellaniella sp.]|uniref:murein hydrolase activator EnvC family protein n=1 Tax=Castellaniella sp. TaxID=1955812 RepID=UPI00355E6111
MSSVAGAAAAPTEVAPLQARQQQAQKERGALRRQIDALQKRIDASEASQADTSRVLKASEQAISDMTRSLLELDERQQGLQAVLAQLSREQEQQQAALRVQQQALASQLRARHASGLSPWSVLLSGRDPQKLGRELGWLSYVARARTQTLAALQGTLAELARLQAQTDASLAELAALQGDMQARQQALQAQEQAHRQAYDRVAAQLVAERSKAQGLQGREQQLGALLEALKKEIAAAEARRRAAEQAAREQAAREQAAREQAVQEQAAQEQVAEGQTAQEQVTQAQAAPENTPRTVPEGGFSGLKKGLPLPVAGEMQGRFGAQRPDGGLWRGVVLRAPEDTPVHAVAAGRVVYAGWLAGFGNLMIIDHGQQYLSVYAYNRSLLREVGDVVAAGDVLARVGATGGQVEPGLYFELRHEGAPINPQLWLRP